MVDFSLVRDKPFRLLKAVCDGSGRVFAFGLHNDLGITYAYTHKLLKKFERIGLVSKERFGNVLLFSITAKGAAVVVELSKISEAMKDDS